MRKQPNMVGRVGLLALVVVALFLAAAPVMGLLRTAAAREGRPLLADVAGRQPARLNGDLWRLYREYAAFPERNNDRPFQPSNPIMPLAGNRVVIDAAAAGETAALYADLLALGLENGAAAGRLVSGELPIGAIDDLAQLSSLNFARPAYAMTSAGFVNNRDAAGSHWVTGVTTGSVTSQGDAAIGADEARADFGVDGTGVTVGILSDSFDQLGGAAADVASGDLPAGVNLLDDNGNCGGPCSDLGRVMGQIVHDVAPGADLAFATGLGGQANFINNLEALAAGSAFAAGEPNGVGATANNNGSDIIISDVRILFEPMFQQSNVEQAINRLRRQAPALEALYIAAAGNSDRLSYEADYNPSGMPAVTSGGNAHDFDPGPGTDIFHQIEISPSAEFSPTTSTNAVAIILQWDEPFFSVSGAPGAPNDMNIFLLDDPPNNVLAASTDANIGADPVEGIAVLFPGGVTAEKYNVAVEWNQAAGGPQPGHLKKVVVKPLSLNVRINEFDTASSTIYGHQNAEATTTVGAAFYGNTPDFGVSPPLLNIYSGSGGTMIVWDAAGNPLPAPLVPDKPDLVAPDGVDNTFYGADSDGSGFPNLFGTTGATAHVAAAAALMLQVNPTLTLDEVEAALGNTAIDMGDPGFDFDSGRGLIKVPEAMRAVILIGTDEEVIYLPALRNQ